MVKVALSVDDFMALPNVKDARDLEFGVDVRKVSGHFMSTWVSGNYGSQTKKWFADQGDGNATVDRKAAVKKYVQFLVMRSKNPELKPDAQTWVLWHSHVLRSEFYFPHLQDLGCTDVAHSLLSDMPPSAEEDADALARQKLDSLVLTPNWFETYNVDRERFDSVLIKVGDVLSAEALVKDSAFFERLLDDVRPLGYKTLHDVLADGGLFDILSTLYKCFTFAIGREKEHMGPTASIDWFWHSHILETAGYSKDCLGAFGSFVGHKPHSSATTETETRALGQATRDAWKKHFTVHPREVLFSFRRQALRYGSSLGVVKVLPKGTDMLFNAPEGSEDYDWNQYQPVENCHACSYASDNTTTCGYQNCNW